MLNSICNYHPQALTLLDRSSAYANPVQSGVTGTINNQQAFLISDTTINANKPQIPMINAFYNEENINNRYNAASTPNGFNASMNKYQNQLDDFYMKSNNYSNEVNSMISPNIRFNHRRKFSPEEDSKLKQLIEINGPKKWDQIAISMPGRTGRQCRDRYHNYLDPVLCNGPWTKEEDNLLEQKVNEVGQHWNKIIKFFKGRSTNNIKNRWYTYISRQNKDQNQDLQSTNIEKNREPIECHLSKECADIPCFGNIIGDKYNYLEKKSEYSSPSDAIISSDDQNGEEYKKGPSTNIINSNSFNLDILPTKSKDKKKIFFPLICPPADSFIFPLNFGRLNFLSQECED